VDAVGDAGGAVADLADGCGCLGDLHCLPLLIGLIALPPLLIWML
jgi:hypothetical protein